MYTSKKLIKVDDADDKGVLLHFKDGTTELVDALIGADGVHGYVRKHILGADHPATEPVFAGWWDCRNLVPYEKAREKLGEKYFEEDRQYGWLGEGGFIMHDVLEHGKLVQCVGAILTDEPWDSTEWKRSLDQKKLEESFAPWLDGPIAKGMIEVSRPLDLWGSRLTIWTLAAVRSRGAARLFPMGTQKCSYVCQRPCMCYRRCGACSYSLARIGRGSGYRGCHDFRDSPSYCQKPRAAWACSKGV